MAKIGKKHKDERPGHEPATVEGTPERNAEGGVEAEGAKEHQRHPRSSGSSKSQSKQKKHDKSAAAKHAPARKAGTTTTGN